jgi:hypothetical protein
MIDDDGGSDWWQWVDWIGDDAVVFVFHVHLIVIIVLSCRRRRDVVLLRPSGNLLLRCGGSESYLLLQDGILSPV